MEMPFILNLKRHFFLIKQKLGLGESKLYNATAKQA